TLQLGQPLQLLAPLIGDLRLGSLLPGDVSGGGEHAEHAASRVLVDRGVVQNLGEMAVAVTNRQRVVGDRSLGEYLLVAGARLVGLGEVVRKVGPDQLLAQNAG